MINNKDTTVYLCLDVVVSNCQYTTKKCEICVKDNHTSDNCWFE